MFEQLFNAIKWMCNQIEIILCSWFTAALCYFLEIKGAIHVMLAIMAFDLLAGIIASMWRRQEHFSMSKFSLAAARASIFIVFVLLIYALDKETHQDFAATYYIAVWIISGGYLWSFLKNAAQIFGGGIFKILQAFVKKQVEEKTGFDITEKEVENATD